jgi:hypothetical protein
VSEVRDNAVPPAPIARTDRKPFNQPGDKRPVHKASPGISDLPSESDSKWAVTLWEAGPKACRWPLADANLDVFCPGCGTSRPIDLRKVDRHPLASVATLVLGLRCSWCPETAPMPRILGLHALPPAAKAAASNL